MVTQKEKYSIQAIGAILILAGIVAFFHQEQIWVAGKPGYYIRHEPYRGYALPLCLLGVTVLVIGYPLPLSKTIMETKFCPRCGQKMSDGDSKFCPHCGYKLK